MCHVVPYYRVDLESIYDIDVKNIYRKRHVSRLKCQRCSDIYMIALYDYLLNTNNLMLEFPAFTQTSTFVRYNRISSYILT